MKDLKQKLTIEQMDKKLELFLPLAEIRVPERGWIHGIRTSLKMSYRQFAARLDKQVTPAKSIETREIEGGVTLKTLNEAARALNMKLVYGFVPIEGSLQQTLENKARALATDIVMTTSHSMALEDQENSKARLKDAIADKTLQIMNEMPRYLWD